MLFARQIAKRLDQFSGESVFLRLFDEVSASQALPDFEPLFRELGITIGGGTVHLDLLLPNAALRRGIVSEALKPGNSS